MRSKRVDTASQLPAAQPGAARRGVFDQVWLLMMLPGLFWGGNAVLGRAVVGEVPPVALAFWRWALGALFVLPFAWRHLRGDLRPMLRAWPIMLALSALGIAVFNTFLYIAAQTTTALNIVMLQTAMPVLIVGMTFVLFGETITLRQAWGIVVSLIGTLVLIARGDLAVLTRLAFDTGDLWMLAAVVSYAFYTVLLRYRPPVHGLSFLIATFVLGAAMLLPLYLAETLSGDPLRLDATSVLAIGYVSIFPSIFAYLAFNRVVTLSGPNVAGLAVHLVPVFGTILAILLLGEVPRLFHGAGIILIFAGVWMATRK